MAVLPIRVPWTHKPSHYVPVDTNGEIGKYIGLGYIFNDGGDIHSIIGHQNFIPNESGATLPEIEVVNTPRSAGRTARFVGNDSGNNKWYEFEDDTINPITSLQNFTVVAGFSLKNGDINNAGGDPRIFSKDIGSSESDHTLMIGFTNLGVGSGFARCRIGFNGSRANSTLYAGESTGDEPLEDGSLNVIAARYDGSTLGMSLLRDGKPFLEGTDGTKTGDLYTNTDTSKIGRNSGINDNHFSGNLHFLYFINNHLTEEELTSLQKNPYIVLRPRTIYIPYAAGISVSSSSTASFESKKGISDAYTSPNHFETLLSLSQSKLSSLETLVSRANSAGCLIETLEGLSSAGAGLFESLASVTGSDLSPFENIKQLSQAKSAGFEGVLGVTAARLAVVESLALSSRAIAVQYETTQGLVSVSNAKTSVYETLKGVSLSQPAAFESRLGLVAVSRALSSTFETLQGVSASQAAPLVVLAGIARNEAGQLETVSQVVVSGSAALEALVSTSRGLAVSDEALALVQAASPVALEALGAGIAQTYEELEMILSGEIDLEMVLTDFIDVH